jgi:hypothetical protein
MLGNLFERMVIAISLISLSLPLAAEVAIPTAEYLPVTDGPVAERSVPLITQAEAIAGWGYIEEEYLLTGTANIYDYIDNAAQSPVVAVTQAGLPYTTRLLIRRPANSKRFNGAVYLDILNATRGYDSDITWHYSADMIMRQGAIYVGMTSKTNTIKFMRDEFGRPPHIPRNYSRYANLLMTHDGQVWDMLSQTAALMKSDAEPSNPLGGMGVERVILTGYSQSAGYVKTYVNSFHKNAVMADGRNVIDAYFEGAGSFASKTPDSVAAGAEFNPGMDPRNKILLPVPAPLMRFQTETEVISFFNSRATRQTEADSPLVRTYEMAGGAHVDAVQRAFEAEQDLIEIGRVSQWPECTVQPSNLRVEYVHSALLSRLDDWLETGREPPPSQLLSIVSNDKGRLFIETDADGNPVGGIRLPQLEVPTGVWSGANPELWCLLHGSYVPFSDDELAARYPWHRGYVFQTYFAVVNAYRDGTLLFPDAWAIYWEALQSDIGERRARWWRRQ